MNLKDYISIRDYIYEGDDKDQPKEFFDFIKNHPNLEHVYYIDDVQVAIRMIYNGALCGYIINPQLSFPKLTTTYFMHHYDNFDTHGDINFKDYNRGLFKSLPDVYFLIGFDCGHACDYLPNLGPASSLNKNKPYRSEQYVHEQLVNLISQIKRLHNSLV